MPRPANEASSMKRRLRAGRGRTVPAPGSPGNAVGGASRAGRRRAREVAAMRPEPQLMTVQGCCPIRMILGQIRTRAEGDRDALASFPLSRPG